MRRKEGVTAVRMKDSEYSYAAKLEEYDRIKSEFMAGKPFIEFETIYGHEIILRVGQIEGLIKAPSWAQEALNQDNKKEKKEDAIS